MKEFYIDTPPPPPSPIKQHGTFINVYSAARRYGGRRASIAEAWETASRFALSALNSLISIRITRGKPAKVTACWTLTSWRYYRTHMHSRDPGLCCRFSTDNPVIFSNETTATWWPLKEVTVMRMTSREKFQNKYGVPMEIFWIPLQGSDWGLRLISVPSNKNLISAILPL